jgi:phenylpyruvate tautomerase PptA (4-oxalocrotonate tautomerase family)
MPFVRIDLRAGKPASHVRAIGAAVQRAMVDTLGVPERDRFQVITEHPPEYLVFNPDYLDIRRSEDIVLVQITLSVGRTTEQKQAFYARLASLLREDPGLRPEDLAISLVENTREDWSFGNGEASYVVLPREQWR